MKLPKSVEKSQKYLTPAFPLILAYGAVQAVWATPSGRVALGVCFLVVFTGWLSFGLIGEGLYNDLLLFCDLGLIAAYIMATGFAGALGVRAGSDVGLWAISSMIFVLYSLWDVSALIGRDTRAIATATHLRRFAKVCGVIGLLFGVGVSVLVTADRGGQQALVESIGRPLLLVSWIGILIWWHWGWIAAALHDIGGEVEPR